MNKATIEGTLPTPSKITISVSKARVGIVCRTLAIPITIFAILGT